MARGLRGQDVVEYGLIIALVALVVLFAIHNFGETVFEWFGTFAGRITTNGVR
jgi:Flp pilus assembly pilin Flp